MGDLIPVGPFIELRPPGDNPDPYFAYRSCDFCNENACQDIWAGKLAENQWRKFYRSEKEGLNVCEHCVPEYLSDEPTIVVKA